MNQQSNNSSITRRTFLKLATGGVIGATALTLGIKPFHKQASGLTQTTTRPAMGTFVEITGVGESKSKVIEAIDCAYSRIDEVDSTMSVFDENSNVYRVNVPGSAKVDLTPGLTQVLLESKRISELTDGSFDVTSAPLLNLWGYYTGKLTVPDETHLQETLKLVGYQSITVNPDTNTLLLDSPQQAIDLGGVAKGYAVDEAIDALKASGLTGGLVNAGGDIRGFGNPSNRSFWKIGLQYPGKENQLLAALKLILPAITTSGNYESFFTYSGNKLAHIIDPRTGKPVEDVLSVSVMAKTATFADGLSTGLFAQRPDQALSVIEGLDDTELVYIYKGADRQVGIKLSSGLRDEVNKRMVEARLN